MPKKKVPAAVLKSIARIVADPDAEFDWAAELEEVRSICNHRVFNLACPCLAS